jgi:hypothetical protein
MTAPKPMSATALRRLMDTEWTPPPDAGPSEQLDGNPADPAIARILLTLRETVAEATCEAIRALRAYGVDDDGGRDLVRYGWRRMRRPPKGAAS